MSDELPSGWAEVELRECADIFDNQRVPVNSSERAKRPGDVPYYGATGQVGWIDKALFDEELLLIGEDGAPFFDKSKPIAYVIKGKSWVNNHAHVIRAKSGISSNQYLKWFLDRFDFNEYVNGTTRLKLTQGAMNRIPVVLAPLAEQRRIVAKLAKLLGQVDACQQRLEKLPTLLKRFRQSILAAACSGRLTTDWREERTADYTDYTDKKPSAKSAKSVVQSLSDDDAEDDELPRGWQKKSVEELIPKGGIFDGPFGSNLKSDDYTESGVRVIRLENIGQLRFIAEKETFISREKYETLTRHTVGAGDIIFASFIMDEVRACVLPKLSTEAIAKADCFCLRPNPDLVDRQYLVFQLISQKSYNALVESVHGATRPRINTTQLRKLEVRVCPLAEQQEIVRRVESLFALADQLELRLKMAVSRVGGITPSLLARAFAGKLVPQDPRDEPASVLLERIEKQHNRRKRR